MKEESVLHFAFVVLFLALMPLCLSAKDASKPDYTVKDYAFPDGTVSDVNLFKTSKKYQSDLEAYIGAEGTYSEYTKYLRHLSKEEMDAWRSEKKSVEDEIYFMKQYSEAETDLLGIMKKQKASNGSFFTFDSDNDRLQVILVRADKSFKALEYEKFYLVQRADDEMTGYLFKNGRLPDGTETDLVMFASYADFKDFHDSYFVSGSIGSVAGKLALTLLTNGLMDFSGQDGYWKLVYSPTIKDATQMSSDNGSVNKAGFVVRHYSPKQMGELGKFMDKNEFHCAAFVKDIGDNKRQLIEIGQMYEWSLYTYKKIDYVWTTN